MKKNIKLGDDEEVVYNQYAHWWIFITPSVIFLIGFYIWFQAVLKGGFSLSSLLVFDDPIKGATGLWYQVEVYLAMSSRMLFDHMPVPVYEFLSKTYLYPKKWLGQIVMLYGVYRLTRAFLTFLSLRITLTNHRMLIETGVILPQSVSFPRVHMDALHIKKGLISRFVNVGTLIIQASGGLTAKIPSMKYPEELTALVVDRED